MPDATVKTVTRGPATVYVVRLVYHSPRRVRLGTDGRGVPIFFDRERAEAVADQYRPSPARLFDPP